MSTMNGNPHYESAALDGIVFSSDDAALQTTELMIDRLAEATLALAYEQRTANLMQFLVGEEGDEARKLWAQVEARLGLNGAAS